MVTLGGNVCVRNGKELDYCWQLAVQSLMPVCDEIVVCDCESTDGTWEKILRLAKEDSRIRPVQYKWTNPKGDALWWVNWLNFAREQLHSEWHIQLDADEVLHENSIDLVRRLTNDRQSAVCDRFNFWKDSHHLIPHGECCGFRVTRLGPKNLFMPSDHPDERAQELMRAANYHPIQIFHYGFIRRRDGFFKKAKEVGRIWANSYDPRMEQAEKFDGNWSSMPGITGWEDRLIPFTGTHPEIAKPWLTERGYDPRPAN